MKKVHQPLMLLELREIQDLQEKEEMLESAGTEDRKVAREHQERKGNLDHQALMEQREKREIRGLQNKEQRERWVNQV